tara:strand:+ start:501 stop:1142 length:642 start_codon:yes stop_codon:yes gene_type:complete
MKKLIVLLFGTALTFATSAFAGGMVGVKFGTGDLTGNADSYTSGGTTYSAATGSKDSLYGAIFAEMDVPAAGPLENLSVGVEYVPLDADVSLDNKSAGTSANVGDFTTIYAMISADTAGDANVYAKLGYAMADVGTVKSKSTVVSQDDSIEGYMIGFGLQSDELAGGMVIRAEYTRTEFDDVSITTTSNGSASVKKTADGELDTFTISLAKSF